MIINTEYLDSNTLKYVNTNFDEKEFFENDNWFFNGKISLERNNFVDETEAKAERKQQ